MEKGMDISWLDNVFIFKGDKGGAPSALDIITVNAPAYIKREPISLTGWSKSSPAPAPAPTQLSIHPRSRSSTSFHPIPSESISLTAVDTDTASRSQSLEPLFDAFLADVNHYLFLFDESELRCRFRPSEHPAEHDLPIDICLALALGAKYGKGQSNHLPNEWYAKTQLRLLAEYQDDLSLMRALTLICLFEIDDDIKIASDFLRMCSALG
jgi:hypothetical protein